MLSVKGVDGSDLQHTAAPFWFYHTTANRTEEELIKRSPSLLYKPFNSYLNFW